MKDLSIRLSRSPLFTCLLMVAAVFGSTVPEAASAEICPLEYTAGDLDHWAREAVFYQVFVRSFQDSDGDGIGDFNGLTSRLDYLNDGDPDTDTDLGIDALWMLPITESPSYHGYDTLNYDRVELDYGSEADFDRLLVEAHKRGIRVIMDLVVNHTSAWHPWFVQANVSADDSFHDWYVWREDDPGWTQPWSASQTWHKSPRLPLYYYGLFWSQMPDLNFENPQVRAEMIAIARRWLARGLDGFRLDASRHIIEAGDEAKAGGSPETHDWWIEFAREVREEFPDTIFIGENWTTVDEVAPFFGETPHSQLDINFNFDLAAAIVGGARDDTPGLIQETLCDVADYYPPHALDAIFLTNHDMIRVATQVRRPERARLAASLLFTLPGVPFVYYGEELGLVNGPGDEDPEKRTPMRWTEDGGFTNGTPWKANRKAKPEMNVTGQQADPDSMWNLYRDLIRLRKTHPALASGGYRPLVVEGSGDVIAFERFTDEQRIVVVANFSDTPRTDLTVKLPDPGSGEARVLFGDGTAAALSPDRIRIIQVGARSPVVFVL